MSSTPASSSSGSKKAATTTTLPDGRRRVVTMIVLPSGTQTSTLMLPALPGVAADEAHESLQHADADEEPEPEEQVKSNEGPQSLQVVQDTPAAENAKKRVIIGEPRDGNTHFRNEDVCARDSASGAKFRSGWSSTPKVPKAQMFVPAMEPSETVVDRHSREGKEAREAAEKEREAEARRVAKEAKAARLEQESLTAAKVEATRLEQERLAAEFDAKILEQEQLTVARQAELDRLDTQKEAMQVELQRLEQMRIDHEKALANQREAAEPAAATAVPAVAADSSNTTAAWDKSEERVAAVVASLRCNFLRSIDLIEAEERATEHVESAVAAREQHREEEDDEPNLTWWQREKCRCTSLLLVLLSIGGIIGLVVGLVKDDGGDTSSALTPLVIDRSCQYRKSQTLYVSMAYSGVDNRMWGSESDFDGNNAVIVSHNADGIGAVWALTKELGSGTWQEGPAIHTDESDQFGWDVAIHSNLVVIGAPGYQGREVYHPTTDDYRWRGRGAAVLVARNKNGDWNEPQTLLPQVADNDAAFGISVDISSCGCYIAVGAWHDIDSRGSVYVFSKSSSGSWTETQKISPTYMQSQSDSFHGNFGKSVAINDVMLAVKAPFDCLNGVQGVAFLFKRDSDGNYEETQRLSTPEGSQVEDVSGSSLLFLDDFLLVGSSGTKNVYVFKRNGSGSYQKTTELTASDASSASTFGLSIDGRGRDALVRDCGDDSSYLFSYADGVWKEKAKFGGCNAAISGNSIVAASNEDFKMNGSRYGGPVNFYDLVCESV